MLCLTVLAHSSLKETKLRRHLESNHGNFVNKSLEVFEEKEHQVKRSRIDRPTAWGGIIYSHSHAVRASFAVAWKIARAKAPHTAGENLIKPASVEMARIMCGDAVANKLEMVSLSNHTMKRRIKELSRNVLQQTIAAIRHCERFSLQLDETTDIGSNAQLMVFVRYFDTNDFVEQFLFCRPLAKNTTGEEIFKKVDFFYEEHQLEWSNCVSVCADGAPAMMGSNKGFMSFVKRKNNNISVVHCLLHRENLATKEIQENLAIVFKEVVSVVNYIKSRPLNTRLFRALCHEMGAELSGLLFHSTVRWLSRGKVLERVATLREENHAFLKEQNHELADRFRDDEWIAKLLFLADVFSHVNQLNSSMQVVVSSSSSYSVFIRCFPFSRDGRIYPIPSAISRTPSLHLSRLRASSFFKPTFSVSSSTCFFQVFFGRPRFLLPVTSRFRATLKTLSSSLLSTCPYHLTPFAVANRSIVSFNPNISICSSVVFLSTIF